jgi:TRAP-type C4-dicarboxylate transport system substrate-binding protein
MSGVKMWAWEGDPIAEAAFKALGVSPIPLSVVDVLTSLQTGLINGAYTSPLAALALQWNTRVSHMLDLPLADASGAVVVSKKMYDRLPADLQEILVRNGRKFMGELTRKSREENAAAITTMKRNGLNLTAVADPQQLKSFAETGKRARQMLAGRLYDQQFLDRVEQTMANFRVKAKGAK